MSRPAPLAKAAGVARPGVQARLGRPFTASEAKNAWGTTRRVAIPLLEHLDRRGWTRRLEGQHREVVR